MNEILSEKASFNKQSIKSTGKYTFEWLDKKGNVVHKETRSNAITEHAAKYQEYLDKYRSGTIQPTTLQKLVPGLLCLYDDTTPVDTSLGYRDFGTLVGTADLTRNNVESAEGLIGGRVMGNYEVECVDNNTQKVTYSVEFTTGAANGTINKARVFAISDFRSIAINEYDVDDYRTYYERQTEYSQGVTVSPSLGSSLPTEGTVFRPVGWDYDELLGASGPAYASEVVGPLTSTNSTLLALSQGNSLDTTAPKIGLCLLARGYNVCAIPNQEDVSLYEKFISPLSKEIQLPTLTTLRYRYSAAGALCRNNDYILAEVDLDVLTIHRYEAANDYIPTVNTIAVTQPVSQRFMGATVVGDTLYVAAAPNYCKVITVWTIDLLTNTLSNTSTLDVSGVNSTNRMTNSNVSIGEVWFDTSTQGWIIEYIYGSTSTDSPTNQSHVWYMWYDGAAVDNGPLTNIREYILLGSVIGWATPIGTTRPSGEDYGYYGHSIELFDNLAAYVRQAGESSTSTSNGRSTVYLNKVDPTEGVIISTNKGAKFYARRPFCPIQSSLLSEAAVTEFTKTDVDVLRVTYELTTEHLIT